MTGAIAVFSDDGFRMMRAVFFNVIKRFSHARYDLNRNNEVEEFRTPVFFNSLFRPWDKLDCFRTPSDLHAGVTEELRHGRKKLMGDRLMYEQGFYGITDSRSLHFCIENNFSNILDLVSQDDLRFLLCC